jgi:cellulose synthase/poly-beta-1,6-N-acetylglucosamine synthase-like glycosyltransferase
VVERPLLSFLVPVWNERRHIAAFVAAYRGLGYEPRELVLCAGGPDGSLAEALRWRAPDVLVLEQRPGEGKQRALGRCFAACRGDLLFLTDADARLDDQAVEATLQPILSGQAQAATGTRLPRPEQRGVPIVAYQWALEAAGNARIGEYSSGMLGSNAALTRAAAEAAGSFSWEALTGTDYALACRLRRAGIAIRFVPESRMPVGLAMNLRSYGRQRARWLRNLVLVGRRYGDWPVVRQGVQPMLIGAAFALLPLAPGRLRRPALALWIALILTAWRRRVAHVRAAPAEARAAFPGRLELRLLGYAALDMLTWSRAAVETVVPAWRGRW